LKPAAPANIIAGISKIPCGKIKNINKIFDLKIYNIKNPNNTPLYKRFIIVGKLNINAPTIIESTILRLLNNILGNKLLLLIFLLKIILFLYIFLFIKVIGVVHPIINAMRMPKIYIKIDITRYSYKIKLNLIFLKHNS